MNVNGLNLQEFLQSSDINTAFGRLWTAYSVLVEKYGVLNEKYDELLASTSPLGPLDASIVPANTTETVIQASTTGGDEGAVS